MSKHILFKANILAARYDSEIHGERTILIVDPNFVWPQIEQQNDYYDTETSFDGPTNLIDDPDVTPRMTEVINPLCKIPADAIEVSEELFYKTINEQDGIWSLVDGQVVKLPPAPQTLAELKQSQLAEIRKAYAAAAIAPVSALDKRWDGGFESAIKLDAAMRLSQAAGAEGVVFYDFNNIAHELSFADALQVCVAVASAYQTALSKKQALFATVEAVQVSNAMTEAQAIEALTAIEW